MPRTGAAPKPASHTRLIPTIVCAIVLLTLLAGSWLLPFVFESSSILYKFGKYKIFLRSAKLLGLSAAPLALVQILSVSRFRLMEEIFPIQWFRSIHKWNGILMTLLLLTHPVLVLAAEKFTMFPFEKRYWPEFLGMALLLFLLLFTIIALFRANLGLAYRSWRLSHRIGAPLFFLLMVLHIRFVSETFETGLPMYLLYGYGGLVVLIFGRLWLRRLMV